MRTKNTRAKTLCRAVAIAATMLVGGSVGATAANADVATAPVEVYSEVTSADIAEPAAADSGLTLTEPTSPMEVEAARTATQAINWYKNRRGSTAYQGYCERAARLAWSRVTHHASAIQHWNSSDGARHKNRSAPKGAFVFWNISAYGHVGIADGNGGFWATSVNGRIGHATSLGYFTNYLGWKPGNDN